MGLFDRFRRPRETAAARADWLEQATSAAANQAQRTIQADLAAARRSFDAAETPPWTESWPTQAAQLNEDLVRQLPVMRARSRGLARNNEWARRFLTQLHNNLLGPAGIRLQMRMTLRGGAPNTTVNDRLEAAWAAWGRRGVCEVSGRHTWQDCERILVDTLARDGEILIHKRPGGGPHRFQIQILPPELLDVELNRDWQGRRVRMGVEITDDGQPVAYWLRMHRSGDAPSEQIAVGRHTRVPAARIIHRFMAEEADQLRGYPWLSVGARRLWLLKDFDEAAAVASSNAAKRVGFFVSPNGDAPPGFADTIVSSVLDAARAAGKVLTPDEIQAITAAAEKYATTVPGQFDTLPAGYDFRPFASDWPKIEAADYAKHHVRAFAAGQGVSYVTLGNDLEAVNFSSARVGILDEREQYKQLQTWLIAAVHEEVFSAWLPAAILIAPDLATISPSRLDQYLAAATWQPRRWAGIDPVKEAAADETNLGLKLTSRRRIILARGEDPDEIAAEIAREEALYGPAAQAAPSDQTDNENDGGDADQPPARARPRAVA